MIAQRFVEERQNVRAKEPVVQFQDVDEIDIAVDVPETVMVADIRSADIVQMVAEFSGAPGLEFPVRIREIAQVADPTTQTFQVRVAMKAPPGMNVLPGMTATVTLTYRRASILGDRILVPISAVFKDATGEQVAWVVGPDQTVIAPPGEARRGDGRPDRNRGGAAAGRPHRRGGGDVPARRHEGARSGRRTRRRPVMNPGEFSVRNNRVVFVAMLFVLVGGFVAYQQMGRLEDPEFTIKEALIITPYPGASAEEVAKEVTNPIESAVQQLGQLERVESESSRGMSVVTAVIKDRYHRDAIPQVWDELRRKIDDVQPQLPPSVRGRSMVIDDFGDVFGIFLAITGDGYSFPELRRYAEFLRRELLLVPDVKRVELFAAQQEVVFLEISRQRLAQLGINEEQIYSQLQERNVAADGGRVRVGDQHIALDPQGGFRSAEDMLDLVIGSDQTGRQLFLRDVATLERGDQDPPRRLLRYDGKPAIGLGISTVQGGNVVTMGEGVRRKLEELKPYQPLGIEIGEINFQPEAVSAATSEFMFNLGKAVTIVFVVLLFAMGRKTGLIIGMVLFLTIMATFLVMYMKGDLLMERISLGALIIALCMLTDNAIIVIEGIKVGIEAGEDKLKVVREVVAENQWPLFGATAIGIIAFAAIGLSEDASGGVYQLALLGHPDFPEPELGVVGHRHAAAELPVLQADRRRGIRQQRSVRAACRSGSTATCWFWRSASAGRWWSFPLWRSSRRCTASPGSRQSFFPPATRPQFMVDVFLPAGTHIRETEAFASDVQRYIQALPGVTHVTSFIGGGGLRFLLVYSPEGENRAFVQFLVDVDDWRKIDGLIADIQRHLDEQHPNANAVAKKFLLGPGAGGRIQARFRGPDPAQLRALADQAKRVLEDDGGAVCRAQRLARA